MSRNHKKEKESCTEDLRDTGLEVIGDLPWGSHFSQFYADKEDLLSVLVPYFKAGLEKNEFCMWVTSEPLGVEEAKKALKKAFPGLDQCLAKGQIEFHSHTEWYLKDGVFDPKRVLEEWVNKYIKGLSCGYQGLRLTGNTFWLNKELWEDFTQYERAVDNVIGSYRMMALCTYSLEKCGAGELLDVVSTHPFALIKRKGKWDILERSEHKLAEEVLRRSNMELEKRVQERTSELTDLNRRLQEEASERRRMSKAFERQSRRLDAFFKHVLTPLAFLDKGFNFIMVSDSYAKAAARDRDEFAGRNHFELYPHDGNKAIFESVVMEKKPYMAFEKPFEYPDHPEWGATYWDWSLVPILDNAGEVEFLVYSLNDVTARKRAEVEKEGIQAQLIESQKMDAVGKLASGIAHDFNNLLTVIVSYVNLGLKEGPSGPLKSHLEQIEEASARAANLTKQLLTFSRNKHLELEAADLNETVKGMLNILQRLITENIFIKTAFKPGIWAIKANQGNIEQLIMNLVVNARDAMPKGGTITVATDNAAVLSAASGSEDRTPGSYVCLTVKDTGAGMDEAVRKKLFEPFFTTKGRVGGLGLSVVKNIVKEHKGWIDVDSVIGEGSTFKVYFPATHEALKNSKKAEIETHSGNGERVLVVEDEATLRNAISIALKKNGYDVAEVSGYDDASAYLSGENRRFDILLSDLTLKNRNGVELAEEAVSKYPALKVVITSGYMDTESYWPRIKELGFFFLQKPFDIPALLNALGAHKDSSPQ
ncbi:MAG: MEDS domain-containing protein [Deltaproteobacteria bacterium]|nr:MEDS domain-containing protein [Deltaproteobacteria bacterium]